MKNEMEINIRGKQYLRVLPLCKINSGVVICGEYTFLIFNTKNASDIEKDKLDRIMKIIEENK